jgi:hypothetical protein
MTDTKNIDDLASFKTCSSDCESNSLATFLNATEVTDSLHVSNTTEKQNASSNVKYAHPLDYLAHNYTLHNSGNQSVAPTTQFAASLMISRIRQNISMISSLSKSLIILLLLFLFIGITTI